jgi:UDPglucose 6-dehydrogenase
MSTNAPIVVVGAGPVGLLTAVGLSGARSVRLVDRRGELIARISEGDPGIWEPGLNDRLAAALEARRLRPGVDLAGALEDREPKLVFVAVGTPGDGNRDESGERADMSAVDGVLEQLLGYEGIAIVMKSTVPPGTGEAFVERARMLGSDVAYLSCPEFLQEGQAIARLESPDRIVVGRDRPSWASQELRELHGELYPRLLEERPEAYIETDLVSAELVKHCSNLHLAMRISFANQAAAVCEELGGDVVAVMRGVGADRRIGERCLEAGVGFGGSCFEKDVEALRKVASEHELPMPLAEATLIVNRAQPERAARKLSRRLGGLEGRRIALLGIAFKAGTADVRASPVFGLAAELRARGARVIAWDPRSAARSSAIEPAKDRRPEEVLDRRELASSWRLAVQGADAVVVVTAWDEIVTLDWALVAELMAGDLLLDGRNALDEAAVRRVGLRYEGTGRSSTGLMSGLQRAGGGWQ